MFTISANYNKHKTTEYNWLMRESHLDPDKAEQKKSLYLTNVSFKASDSYEKGFGCRMVAVSHEVKEKGADKIPDSAVRVRFNGRYDFFVGSDVPHCHIASAKEMWLTENNEIWADGIEFKK